MAVLAGGNEGALNGTTPVTLVAAPSGTDVRIVPKYGISISNKDTASVTVTISKNKGGTLRELQQVVLATGDLLVMDKTIVLDATNESIEAVMSGAPATTQPDFDAAFATYS